jgi:hypothetical protein
MALAISQHNILWLLLLSKNIVKGSREKAEAGYSYGNNFIF